MDQDFEKYSDVGSTISSPQTIKYQNVMDQIDAEPTLRRIFQNLSGLTITHVNSRRRLKRERKPKLTHDCVMDTFDMVMLLSNPVTTQTDWDNNRINSHLRDQFCSFVEYLATVGNDSYISHKSWARIIEIHAQGHVDKEGNYISGWYSLLGLNWQIAEPVRSEQLVMVKDQMEEVEQFIVLKNVLWSLFAFADASLRRSIDALTLKHLQEVIKETHVQQQEQKKKGIFGSLLNGIGRKETE